ncbi:MAG: CP12 domain-containing protein [Trichodesmium sp.]
MSNRSSEKQIMGIFPQADSVTNLEDIEDAKSLIAWQIFEELMGSAVNQHRQQITSMFNDYCKENPHAVECNIYS